MRMVTKVMTWYKNLNAKQFALAGVFAFALFASIGMGLVSRTGTSAAIIRDEDYDNSIDGCINNGGIGAENAAELIKDIKDSNAQKCVGGKHTDLATIYSQYNLKPADYDRFVAEAQQGELFRNGHVELRDKDGKTVTDADGKPIVIMDEAVTMGRTPMGLPESVRKPLTIDGKTYYQSKPEVSFSTKRQSLPVMIWFDEQGAPKTVIMNACGNVVEGKPKTPKVTCDALVATQPDKDNKPNTYEFTTHATVENAVITKVVYDFGDGSQPVEKSKLTDKVTHNFTKDAEVSVTVYAKTASGKELKSTVVVACKKKITYVPPMCTLLEPSALDEQKRNFRFTAKTSQDDLTTVKSVDFTLDGTATTTGVTTKDGNGNIYKEYKFTDEKEHTVVAKVNFTVEGGQQSVECRAKVTPTKLPKCEVPGFENLPPNDERCGYCKPPTATTPGIPKGDKRCTPTPPVMPSTGPADVAGLFAGTSLAGFLGHKLYLRRRASR